MKSILRLLKAQMNKIYQSLFFLLKYKRKIIKINKKISNNNKQNIIPIIIDCELSTLNQYLEPVVEELIKIPGQLFEFYFGETIKDAGSSYIRYNKKNTFPVEIYPYLKGNMIFLSPHIYPKGPPSALKIFFDHAICSAKFSHHPEYYYTYYDIHCVTGKINEEKVLKILKQFNLSNKVKVVNIGYPKSDKLFNGLLSKNDIFEKLKLDPRKKTILYAPSWEEGLSLREYGLSMIEEILKNKEINFIIKPHPVSLVSKKDKNYQFYCGGINWSEKLSRFKNNSNFVFYKNNQIDELLTISDIMITDLSSVALEFIILEKPVIYLDCPKFEKAFKTIYKEFNDISYSDLLNNPLCNAGRHVGLVNYDYKTINDNINFIIKNPDYKINERLEYANNLLSNKGISSKVCSNMIIDNFVKYIEKQSA